MSTQSNQANLIQLLRRIPPKWALAIIGLVLLYWLGQPVLNRTFGWNLPTFAAIVGEDNQHHPRPNGEDTRTDSPATKSSRTSDNTSKSETNDKSTEAAQSKATLQQKDATKPPRDSKSTKQDTVEKQGSAEKQPTVEKSFLTEFQPNRYRSPAGLLYQPGSQEGHRLKHIARHLKDQPDRPGSHGVFNGDMDQVLRWIDEAYQKAKKGDRSARTFKQEDGSTKYEVTFDKPIGYIGGSDGKRKGNPPAKRLRIIVYDQSVTTAFPF